jgi:hypothetical protein
MTRRIKPVTPRFALLALLAPAFLAACGSGDPSLMNFVGTRSPNEFLIVPAKPLATPPSQTALPPPTPGAQNRADATPLVDAVVALGGSAAALETDGATPGADSALLAHTARYGRDPQIRDTLASEDLAYRKANQGRVLEQLFNVNRYYDSYDAVALDQQEEMDRLRRLGIETSSAPPSALKPQ